MYQADICSKNNTCTCCVFNGVKYSNSSLRISDILCDANSVIYKRTSEEQTDAGIDVFISQTDLDQTACTEHRARPNNNMASMSTSAS